MQKVEIICNNCHKESFINKEPIYEGLTKIGEKVSCTSCGFVYTNEKDIPYKDEAKKYLIFDEDDKSEKIKLFSTNETKNLCRQCSNYIINPFTQFCVLHKKEVEATDSCNKFAIRKNSDN